MGDYAFLVGLGSVFGAGSYIFFSLIGYGLYQALKLIRNI
nr:MAG TPA: hypothetical protein [Inoviridae sp.]